MKIIPHIDIYTSTTDLYKAIKSRTSCDNDVIMTFKYISIYIKYKIYMYVCPHISSEITEPNSTKFCMSPRSYHGTLIKKYLTDQSIFAKDMLIF